MPLKLKKRGEIWHYAGTVAGRRLRGSTKTAIKSEAQVIANRVEARYLQGGRDPGSVLTFAQAAIEYRKVKGAPRYLEMVEDHWKDTPVKDITRGAVKRAAIDLLPNAKGAYRNRAVIVPTQAVINYASSLDLCPPLRADRFPEVKATKGTGDVGMGAVVHGAQLAAPWRTLLLHVPHRGADQRGACGDVGRHRPVGRQGADHDGEARR